MENNEIFELIKYYLKKNNINVYGIYLFGSRGRGDYNEDSDYDLLIVLQNNIGNQEKRKLSIDIRRYLIKHKVFFNLDLIIKNHENWEWESQNLGFLSYTVKNEGVLL
jgi:uncharacterized protein